MNRTLVLDFQTVVDPVMLFNALCVYRHAYKQVYIPEEFLEIVYVRDRYQGDITLNLLDERDSQFLREEEYCPGDIITYDNLYLTARLLQHAIRQRYLLTYKSSNATIEGLDWANVEKHPFFEAITDTIKVWILGKNYDVVPTYGVGLGKRLIIDLYNSKHDIQLGRGCLSVINTMKNNKQEYVKQSGVLGAAIDNIQKETLAGYYRLIDSSDILYTVCLEIEKIQEEIEYKKNLLAFVPDQIFDKTTLGVYSCLKMLWVIIKHEHDARKK